MDTILLEGLSTVNRPLVSRSPVTLFVLYEDDQTSVQAASAETELVRRLGGRAALKSSWWKLRFLTHPRVMALATESLQNADVVLLSVSVGSELPLMVKGWLEMELGDQGRHPCAVLALLEKGNAALRQPSPAHAFLSVVAQSGGRSFLHQATASVLSPARH